MPQQWRLGILADQCCSRCQCRQCLANASALSDSPCQWLLYRLTTTSTKSSFWNNDIHRIGKNMFPSFTNYALTSWPEGSCLDRATYELQKRLDLVTNLNLLIVTMTMIIIIIISIISSFHHFIISSFHHVIISSCHHLIMSSFHHFII